MTTDAPKCETRYCRNHVKPTQNSWNRFCSKCSMRRWREAHPVEAIHAHMRYKSKIRGILFDLTVRQLKNWLMEKNVLHTKRVNGKLDWTIDRIDSTLGYEIQNLQILSRSANSWKWHHHDKHQQQSNIPF